MKRKCKNVNIFNIGFISYCILDCLKNSKKRKRYDTVKLFAKLLNTSLSKAKIVLKERNDDYYIAINKQARIMRDALIENKIPKCNVRFCYKLDKGSLKKRHITILTIEHLLYDHVAVKGLDELFKRVGEYQVSSIKGRGAIYGMRAIRRWTRTKKRLYSAKLDIKNFYGSVDKNLLLNWIENKICNKSLLNLIKHQLNIIKDGMAIGSFLSQTLANLYLSDVYHKIKENFNKSYVKHVLFYMDDLLFIGHNKRKLKRVCDFVKNYLKENMKLTVKQYDVHKVTKSNPINMMGYRIWKGVVTLRKYIYRNVRRTAIRIGRIKEIISNKLLKRAASYNGYVCHANLYNLSCFYKSLSYKQSDK